ncbi:MAG: hypothetical protein J5545_10100 [Bacteroidaceae bacterium]|nr:hypothetical protein [Bacteroidaceae bacterium]
MNRMIQWVMAATLACGASVFTSCTSDSEDNPAQEQAKKNRKEFVEHTRATMKNLAENLSFYSWTSLSLTNQHINWKILNNPEFEKIISSAFFQKAQQSIKPVEEGSELAAMGFTMYATVDLTEFNYRFIANDDYTGFDVEEAEDFEIILNTRNPATQRVDPQTMKITLKAGGDTSFKMVLPARQQEGLALVILVPAEFSYDLSTRFTGTWVSNYSGSFQNQLTPLNGSSYAQFGRDSWSVSGVLNSYMELPNVNKGADATTLTFSIANDRVNHKLNVSLSFEQNGRKMLDLAIKDTGDDTGGLANLDLSQFNSMSSIFDILAACLTSRSLDEAKITLLDDLTTTLSISDMRKAQELAHASASARRNYADEATIDQYTQQLNQLIKAEMTCKGVNQTIPMKLVTQKFGVDYWTMPAFNFADENGYVSLVDLLDPESVQYGINIIDHAVEPMQQTIIVVRQLLQYVQGLVNGFQQSQGEAKSE